MRVVMWLAEEHDNVEGSRLWPLSEDSRYINTSGLSIWDVDSYSTLYYSKAIPTTNSLGKLYNLILQNQARMSDLGDNMTAQTDATGQDAVTAVAAVLPPPPAPR